MNSRAILLFALALAVAAIVAWFWFGNEAPRPSATETAPAVQEDGVPSASAKGVAPPAPGASNPAEVPSTPVAATTSSVVPGSPMVRTIVSPIPPPVTKGPVVRSQIVPEVEGKPELDKVQMMLRDYRTRMGENPVGSNAEIMKAVMGGNPVKARLGPPEGQNLNADGELLDHWGNPYFFHQLSKEKMEIRSAGPDGKLWTVDDLVSK